MCLYTAIQSTPIDRLQATKANLPRLCTKNLEAISEVFSMDRNNRIYREKVNSRHSSSPSLVVILAQFAASLKACEEGDEDTYPIPYLGLFTKDLFMVEENVPTITEAGQININKLRRIFEMVTLTPPLTLTLQL